MIANPTEPEASAASAALEPPEALGAPAARPARVYPPEDRDTTSPTRMLRDLLLLVAGVSQADIAQRAGVSKQLVGHVFGGIRLSPRVFATLTDLFGTYLVRRLWPAWAARLDSRGGAGAAAPDLTPESEDEG